MSIYDLTTVPGVFAPTAEVGDEGWLIEVVTTGADTPNLLLFTATRPVPNLSAEGIDDGWLGSTDGDSQYARGQVRVVAVDAHTRTRPMHADDFDVDDYDAFGAMLAGATITVTERTGQVTVEPIQ